MLVINVKGREAVVDCITEHDLQIMFPISYRLLDSYRPAYPDDAPLMHIGCDLDLLRVCWTADANRVLTCAVIDGGRDFFFFSGLTAEETGWQLAKKGHTAQIYSVPLFLYPNDPDKLLKGVQKRGTIVWDSACLPHKAVKRIGAQGASDAIIITDVCKKYGINRGDSILVSFEPVPDKKDSD